MCICSYSHVLRHIYDIGHPEGDVFPLRNFSSEKEKKAWTEAGNRYLEATAKLVVLKL